MSNPNTKQAQHGGNPSWIQGNYLEAPTPLIDLSTGINPYGYKMSEPQASWHYQLADTALMQTAFKAMANYCHVQDIHVTLASGMQPLMVALAALWLRDYGISTVAIHSPTYSEHARVWQHLSHSVVPYNQEINADVVIICNPNNPDGRTIAPKHLMEMAKQTGWLIIDESFADLAPESSLAEAIQDHENIIVLRSCGKFFGVAGLRVSAAIASETLTHSLRILLGPWPISTMACYQLPIILEDSLWSKNMRQKLYQEAQNWRRILAEHFTLVGHTALFTLVESDQADGWFHRLASQGILVRLFDYNPRWIRLGLPDSKYLPRLAKAFAT